MSGKQPAVDWVTYKLRPIAQCADCDWEPFFYGNETNDAKSHARAFPGHCVIVNRITKSEYVARVES